jgi:hypothetical protein
VIDPLPETQHQQSVAAHGSNSRAIAVTCTQHGAAGFTNLMVSKHDGTIVLDPHVVGLCVITLDETAAIALFDLLGEWPRMRALSSPAPRDDPANPHQVHPMCVGGTR